MIVAHPVYRFFAWFPRRLVRVLRHFPEGVGVLLRGGHPVFWWLELACYVADLFGVFDLYDGLSRLVKTSTRPLTPHELTLARGVYGTDINLEAVRIDNAARVACKHHRLCYVSFYTINSWGSMREATLVHELMHIWQYERFGAAYIPRALRAQQSAMGYNYGGTEWLLRERELGRTLTDFNYEQQADIMADAFRIQQGQSARWSDATDLTAYRPYLDDLRSGKSKRRA